MEERRRFVRMVERRRFVRIPEDLPISYEVYPIIKTEKFLTRNISQGGICFFVHKFIPKDSTLKIKLTLSKISFYFEAIARLAWIKKVPHSERYEIGVEFINISKEAAKHLIAYITDIVGRK